MAAEAARLLVTSEGAFRRDSVEPAVDCVDSPGPLLLRIFNAAEAARLLVVSLLVIVHHLGFAFFNFHFEVFPSLHRRYIVDPDKGKHGKDHRE